MEILLDTHMLLWWLADDRRLSRKARAFITDRGNILSVSAASAWEIVIKQALGKLEMKGDLEDAVHDQGFRMLPVTFAHTAEVLSLPPIHRDPFDRMLVAQARVENLRLLTSDPQILRYQANMIEG